MLPLSTPRASLPSSLYPHQAITRQFPVGKPITLVGESLEAVEVGEGGVRRKSDGARLEGLVQCVVMAPDSLFLPVLPLRVRGKLMYGLCRTCLEKGLDRLCTHDGSARWLRGTWTTVELAYALGCGYRLVKVHELYVYERMGPIFEKFYLKLARIKLESEGFPTGVETPEDKQRHVDDLNEKMPGLGLSADRVVKNEARRSFAKLVRSPDRLAREPVLLPLAFVPGQQRRPGKVLAGRRQGVVSVRQKLGGVGQGQGGPALQVQAPLSARRRSCRGRSGGQARAHRVSRRLVSFVLAADHAGSSFGSQVPQKHPGRCLQLRDGLRQA